MVKRAPKYPGVNPVGKLSEHDRSKKGALQTEATKQKVTKQQKRGRGSAKTRLKKVLAAEKVNDRVVANIRKSSGRSVKKAALLGKSE